MKKTGLFLLLAAMGFLGACDKTTDTPPGGSPISITITPTSKTLAPGATDSFKVDITDNNTLKDVVVSVSIGGGSSTQLASYTLTGKSYSFYQPYTVPSNVTSGSIVLTFLVDDNSTNNTATATINVAGTGADISAYSAVLLGNYKNPSAGSFFASSTGAVYTQAAAKSNQSSVDMVFFYGSSNMATLASPDDPSFGTGGSQIDLGIESWSSVNSTTFKTTTITDLSTITDAAGITAAYNAGTAFSPASRANLLAANQVIAFKTQPNKMGLAKIVSISADATGAGTMTISVIVQK